MKLYLLIAALALLLPATGNAYTAYPTLSAGSSNSGLVSGSIIGYTVLGADGSTVAAARTTAGVVELGNGSYAVPAGITVPDGSTYYVRWDRSDTGAVLGAAPTSATSYAFTLQTSVATLSTNVAALPTAASFWAYSARTLTAQADTPGTATLLARLGMPTGASLAADVAANSTAIASIPAAVLLRPLGHGLTVGQLLVLLQSGQVANVTNTWSASAHTLTTVYQFAGDSGPMLTRSTVYPTTQTTAPPVQSGTGTVGTLPQP